MSYGSFPIIQKLLNPRYPAGTLADAILVGTASNAAMGTTFARELMDDAGTFINGMLWHRYKTPFSPVPVEINWIANRLTAAYIVVACKAYIADAASNYLYDKQQHYHQMAMTKLQALADGMEVLKGEEIDSVPQGEYDTGDDFEFAVPGSENVRPAVKM